MSQQEAHRLTGMGRARQAVDWQAVEGAVAALLTALGFQHEEDEGLRATPARCSRSWRELLAGYEQSAASVLGTDFPSEGYDSVVVLRDVPFVSLCEHHLMPFTGRASLAYLPDKRVVGLSKMARLVEMHARRLQVQERMTVDIARDLNDGLAAQGVAVVIHAAHSCMGARGVRKPGAEMVTSAMLGVFRRSAEARAEVLALLGETSR
jgi:GTP cyclohydrolase I